MYANFNPQIFLSIQCKTKNANRTLKRERKILISPIHGRVWKSIHGERTNYGEILEKKKRFRPDFYFSKKWIRKRFVVVSRAINPGLTKSWWNFAVKVHCSSHKWSLPPLYTDQNQCKKDLDSNIRDTTFVLISMELGQKPRSIWLTIDVRTLCIDTDIHCQSVHQWNPDIGKCILLLNFLFECSWNFSSLVS